MSRARRLTAALALAGALFALPACASSVDPIERLGRKAAEKVTPRPRPKPAAVRPSRSAAPRIVPLGPLVPLGSRGSLGPLVRNRGIRPDVPSVRAAAHATGS